MRADRLISMILLLQNRGRMTCVELARRLEVSRRTVLRDIDSLTFAGIPLVTEAGPGGGVRLRDEYRTSLTGLTDGEVRSLVFSQDGALFGDLGWGDAYRMGQLKLNASLSAASRQAAETAQRRILIDSRWWWHQDEPDEALSLLQSAVFGDDVVSFDYEHYDGRVTRVHVEAYALVAKSGLWYLVGRHGGELRSYRVSRITAAARAKGGFTRERGFDVRQWWPAHSRGFVEELSSYRCVLSVPEGDLRLIHRMAPGRVKILRKPARKGSRLQVELGVESEWHAQVVVFGLGAGCRIVSPAGLSAAVAARMETVRSALGPSGGKPRSSSDCQPRRARTDRPRRRPDPGNGSRRTVSPGSRIR